VGQHWIYRDEASTNGSWVNGEKILPGVWNLVKPGDYLQLGDVALELEDAQARQDADFDPGPFGIRSLLVFSRGIFQSEYPVPEFGRALVVGGKNADLPLGVDMGELPSLVVERRGDAVAAITISKDASVLCNGQELTQTKVLRDRDDLEVEHYRIIFSDVARGAASQAALSRTTPPASTGARAVSGGGWDSLGRREPLLGQGPGGDPRAAPPGQSAIPARDGEGLSGASLARASAAADSPVPGFSRDASPEWVSPASDEGEGDPGVHASQSSRPGGASSWEESPDEQSGTFMSEGKRSESARSFPWGKDQDQEASFAPASPVPRQPDRLPFGKVGDIGVDQTVAIDPSKVHIARSGPEAAGRNRFGLEESDEEVMSSLEDKVWLTVGLLMVLALILMVVWWLLTR
jgi:hypothetical protein